MTDKAQPPRPVLLISLKDAYRQDPPESHWKNPYRDKNGLEFCGHCGDDWPCQGSQRRQKPLNPGQ